MICSLEPYMTDDTPLYKSTTSFQACDPVGSVYSLGKALDVLKSNISSYSADTTTNFCIQNTNSPWVGGVLQKHSNLSFSGIAFSYHSINGFTVWFFAYDSSDGYFLRPMAKPL